MNASEFLRLSCPKCSAGVRASTQHVGKKLKCPKCGGVIKVPGAVEPVVDDDWLNLDEPAPSSSAPAKLTSPTLAAPSSSAGDSWLDGLPPLSDGDWSALSAAGAMDDPFATGSNQPAFDDLPPPSIVAPVLEDYRAKCPTCESVHFVKRSQEGKSIRCSDCLSSFIAPPPPKVVEKKKFDLNKAATFQLAEIQGARNQNEAPGAKSAAALLRAAEDEVADEVDPHHAYENPDVKGWLRGIFGIFTDPAVGAYWLGLSLIGTVPGIIAVFIINPILTISAAVLAVLYLSYVVTIAFEILETVANGQNRVTQWPTFDPGEWFGQGLLTMSAIFLSAMPGAILTVPIFGVSLLSYACILLSIFAMFPFIILSMLDNGSVTMPISGEVTKSVTRCKESWGTLYFSSMLLFGFQFVTMAAITSVAHPAAAVIYGSFSSIGLVFLYFSMIGQLAFAIGQSINGGPSESDNDAV